MIRFRTALSLSLFIYICIFVVSAFLLTQADGHGFPPTLILLTIVIVSVFYSLSALIFRPFLFMFLFYSLFMFLIPGAIQLYSRDFFWSGVYRDRTVVLAEIFVFLGVLSYLLGYFSLQPRQRSVKYLAIQMDHFCFVCGVIATLAAIYSIQVYGLGTFFSTRGQFIQMFHELGFGTGPLVWLTIQAPRQCVMVFVVASVVYFLSAPNRRIQASVFLIWSGALASVLFFPTSATRFEFLGLLLSVFFCLNYVVKLSHLYLVFGGPALLYFLVPLMAEFSRGLEFGTIRYIPILDYLKHGDFDGFQQMLNSIDYVSAFGFTLGWQLISALFFFIPRSFWTAKGESTGVMLAESQGMHFTNLSAPIFVEAYVDFGLIMVVPIFLIGRITRVFDSMYAAGRLYFHQLVVFAALLGLFPIILRGSFLAIFPRIAVLIFLPLLVTQILLLVYASLKRAR